MSTELAAPPTLADLNKNIKHDLTPDPSWEETGEMHRDSAGNRFPVYVETRRKTRRTQKKSEAGDPLWHLRPDGTRHRPMMSSVVVGEIQREFIYVPLGNGMSQKNYHFRPAPGELEKKRRESEERNLMSDLSRAMREKGMGVADLVAGLGNLLGLNRGPTDEPAPAEPAGGQQKAQDQPPGEKAPDTYPAAAAVSGTWYVSRDHWSDVQHGVAPAYVGTKKEAAAEAAKLAQERDA